MRCNTDLETWLHDFSDRVYRILEYRKPYEYTPYEMENKFVDESIYRDTHYKIVFIEEVIELPDKDILIGFREILDIAEDEDDREYETSDSIVYLKLSETRLECCKCDQISDGE